MTEKTPRKSVAERLAYEKMAGASDVEDAIVKIWRNEWTKIYSTQGPAAAEQQTQKLWDMVYAAQKIVSKYSDEYRRIQFQRLGLPYEATEQKEENENSNR